MPFAFAIVVLLVACETAPPTTPPPGPEPVRVVIDAAAPEAAVDAQIVKTPSNDEALAAARTWAKAFVAKTPDKLVAASTLPFRLVDNESYKCGDGPIASVDALASAFECLQAPLRPTFQAKKPTIAFEAVLPEPDHIISAHRAAWVSVVAPAEATSHVYVKYVASPAEYPAEVTYALLAIRFAGDTAKVDGVVVVHSTQGD